ncbi:hypothetical protein GOBAR_DD23693 [Gossypium barbadense]|nr:hypothetical protein GOBAR_DD23693 [Gossypium barbadense]
MNQLRFDVHFPSRAAWDEFASKWRNLKYFFLDEVPRETIATPARNNEADGDLADTNVAPADGNDNDEVVGKEGKEKIPNGHGGLMICLK